MSTFEKPGATEHQLSKGGYHCMQLCSFQKNLMMLQDMQLAKLWISQKPEYIFDWLYIKGNSPQHGARQVQSPTNLTLKQGEEFYSSLRSQIVKCCNYSSLNWFKAIIFSNKIFLQIVRLEDSFRFDDLPVLCFYSSPPTLPCGLLCLLFKSES